MKVLSLDLSLSCPGWAVLEVNNGNPQLIEIGHIKTNKKKWIGGRLEEIEKALEGVFDRHQDIKKVVRERGFSRFPSVTQSLFRVVGVADLVAWRHGHKITDIPATKIKGTIAGSGKADKAAVESAVRQILNLPESFRFVTDDESDAVAVGLTYIFMQTLKQTLN